jgi:urea transport system permease protein
LILVVPTLAGPARAQAVDQAAPEASTADPSSLAPNDVFATLVSRLAEATYNEKEEIVGQLAASGHPSTRAVLSALFEDRLQVRAADGGVFIVVSVAEALTTLELIDPLTQAAAGSSARDDLTRIGTNNRLRRVLRGAVARFDLANQDSSVRLAAVTELLRSIDDETTALLRERLPLEQDSAVRQEIETGLALAALDGTDRPARLAAIATLSSRLSSDVYNRLSALLEQVDGAYTEPDEEVRRAAARAANSIATKRSLYGGVQTMFFGLSLGSVLVLVAIGLAITFGVMGVINMAHGELMMLGAYTTYVVQTLMPNHIDASLFVAVPAAFLVSGLMGVLIERSVIRFLYGRPLETLLATFGLSLVLQQLVRSIFTALNRSVQTPSWMSGTWQINEALGLTSNRLTIILFSLAVFGVLLLVLKRTTLGLQIRAVAQNRAMARAMGVRSERVDAMTFGLGAGIAGIAGVALSQLTNVGPNLGQSYIIDSFMVVVFGGVGNLWGALVGGLTMGIVNSVLEPYAGAVLAKIVVLVSLILFIQRRPRGLFPQTGRAAEQT